jgi:hypothetical protein
MKMRRFGMPLGKRLRKINQIAAEKAGIRNAHGVGRHYLARREPIAWREFLQAFWPAG